MEKLILNCTECQATDITLNCGDCGQETTVPHDYINFNVLCIPCWDIYVSELTRGSK